MPQRPASEAGTANGMTSRRLLVPRNGGRSGAPSCRMCYPTQMQHAAPTTTQRFRSCVWCCGRTLRRGWARAFCSTYVYSRPVMQARLLGFWCKEFSSVLSRSPKSDQEPLALVMIRGGPSCLRWTSCCWSVRAWSAAPLKAALSSQTRAPGWKRESHEFHIFSNR